mmetsp:Transcript_6973/g.17733  ORF Transcript_6973/g.17733 Transcript_6973/m.17733 type:complete len:238 (+) Transcript_6973:2171-2884(+)
MLLLCLLPPLGLPLLRRFLELFLLLTQFGNLGICLLYHCPLALQLLCQSLHIPIGFLRCGTFHNLCVLPFCLCLLPVLLLLLFEFLLGQPNLILQLSFDPLRFLGILCRPFAFLEGFRGLHFIHFPLHRQNLFLHASCCFQLLLPALPKLLLHFFALGIGLHELCRNLGIFLIELVNFVLHDILVSAQSLPRRSKLLLQSRNLCVALLPHFLNLLRVLPDHGVHLRRCHGFPFCSSG